MTIKVYTCHILYEDVVEEDVHKIYDRCVVSKKAVSLLPSDIASRDYLIHFFMLGCGQKDCRIPPERLHSGIWIIKKNTDDANLLALVTNNRRHGYHHLFYHPEDRMVDDNSPDRLLTLMDARYWVDKETKDDAKVGPWFWIFEDGKLVRTYRVTVVALTGMEYDEDKE